MSAATSSIGLSFAARAISRSVGIGWDTGQASIGAEERYQVVGRERLPLDERQVVLGYLDGGAPA